jgi:cyanophycinase
MFWTAILMSALTVGPDEGVPKGHLIVAGGGLTGEEVRKKALILAGGAMAKVVVIPQASRNPEAGKAAADQWRNAGATDIVVLDLSDPKAAIAQIENADLIWMRGGNQVRLMEAMATPGLSEAIRKRYYAGATVGGTSAGAAVMSKVMIAGYKGPRNSPEGRTPVTADGLGLWPEVIVDQHFAQRNRRERLIRAVRDHHDLLGVGIDEATAVIVSGREFEVLGNSGVMVFDARKPAPAKVVKASDKKEVEAPAAADAKPAKAEEPPAVELTPLIYTLKAGMRFHLDKGPLPPPDAQAATAPAASH